MEGSSQVVVARSVLVGSPGVSSGFGPTTPGGLGLQVNAATLALYDSQVLGGDGAPGTFGIFQTPIPATDGGAALRILAGTVLLAGTEVRGGAGGPGALSVSGCAPPGDGGTGLEGDGLLRVLDSVIAGSAAGAQPGCAPDGVAGTDMAFVGPVHTLPQILRRLQITSPIEEGGSCTISIAAQPFEPVVLLQALSPLGSWLGGLKGTLAGAPPYVVFALGLAGADGTLVFDVALPTGLLPPGIEAALFVDQILTAATGGGGLLGSPSSVLLVGDIP